MKNTKTPEKTTLRLTREVLRVLGSRELAQIEGGRLFEDIKTAASGQDVCCA